MTAPAGGERVSPAWRDAMAAVALVAIDPAALGGLWVRGPAGPARDRLAALLRAFLPPEAPMVRLGPGVGDDRLLGGLDLAATLAAGRPVHERGLLAAADGGALVAPSAERMPPGLAGRLAAALDRGVVAVVALDEGRDDDPPPPAVLTERLGLSAGVDRVGLGDLAEAGPEPDAVAAARRALPAVAIEDAAIEALAEAALALGVGGLRPLMFACGAARASAALAGRTAVAEADLALAARLALGPRAVCAPAPADGAEAPPPPEASDPGEGGSGPDEDADDCAPGDPQDLRDRVLAAAAAALPAGLLDAAAASGPRSAIRGQGRSGATQASKRRGRPIGARAGRPSGGARLDLLATLVAAAPWQAVRRAEHERDAASGHAARRSAVIVRRDDFRVRRLKESRRSLAVFVVDASGSAALHRLAEAKGAVELLLAQSYVRRDEVALIAFRGAAAEIVLPPTRSLARARRALGGLPGGGGTPLASAIDQAAVMAEAARRRGDAPTLVFLTDGQANVARDGQGGRARGQEDAMAAARAVKALGLPAVVIDVSPRPTAHAERLSEAMAARYAPLPAADSAALARVAARCVTNV